MYSEYAIQDAQFARMTGYGSGLKLPNSPSLFRSRKPGTPEKNMTFAMRKPSSGAMILMNTYLASAIAPLDWQTRATRAKGAAASGEKGLTRFTKKRLEWIFFGAVSYEGNIFNVWGECPCLRW